MRELYRRYKGYINRSLLWSFLMLHGFSQPLLAAHRTEAMARSVAEAFFAKQQRPYSSRGSEDDLSLVIAEPRKADSRDVQTMGVPRGGHYYYYIYNRGEQDGFVIVSGDDRYPDLIGYAYKGHLSKECMPNGLDRYLEQCRWAMDLAESNETVADEVCTTQATPQSLAQTVAPLLGNICWDQGEPWNDKTPRHQGYRTAVGCVATAYTQVMRYWKWPERGEGSHTYTYGYDYTDSKGQKQSASNRLTANFDKVYDWGNMPASSSIRASHVEREALATLASDAGIAVDMIYGNDSGTHTPLVIRALRDHFKYKKDLSMQLRKNYTAQAWSELLKTELSNGRPIVYDGGGFGGAHCFVCDGYDERGYFHFNWGWSGRGNGYFNLNFLIPNATGLGANGGEYSERQGAIIGIEPDRDGSSIPLYNSWLGTVSFAAEVSGGNKIILESGSFTSRIEDAPGYRGSVAMGIVNLKSKEVTPIIEQVQPFSSNLFFKETKFFLNEAVDITPYLSEGDYMLCPIHEVTDAHGGSYWRPNGILWEGAKDRFAVYHISRSPEGYYIVARRYLRALWQLELLPEMKLIASNNNKASITLQLRNTGLQEYTERIIVRGRPKDASTMRFRQLSRDMATIPIGGEIQELTFALSDRQGLFGAKEKEVEIQVGYYDVHSSYDYIPTTTYLVPIRADGEVDKEMPAKVIPTTPTHEISVARIGRGSLQLTSLDNQEISYLSMVPEGSTILITATPHEGFNLKALTANGVDILESKRCEVTKDMLIVATFEDPNNPLVPEYPTEKFYKVTSTCIPANGGTVSIIGADNLDRVSGGTTLSVEVSPAPKYELTALMVNGINIFDTKRFTVTTDTEVEATFVNHTGVEKRNSTQRVQIYPNPADSYLFIEGVQPETVVQLYSMEGVQLYEDNVDHRGTLCIALAPYADGTYLVQVAGEMYRLVIRHQR